jgi:hypothetical protein
LEGAVDDNDAWMLMVPFLLPNELRRAPRESSAFGRGTLVRLWLQGYSEPKQKSSSAMRFITPFMVASQQRLQSTRHYSGSRIFCFSLRQQPGILQSLDPELENAGCSGVLTFFGYPASKRIHGAFYEDAHKKVGVLIVFPEAADGFGQCSKRIGLIFGCLLGETCKFIDL